MRGGFVSAGQQGHTGGEQFVFGELIALLLGRNQGTDQVVSRVFPTLCNDATVISCHLSHALLRAVSSILQTPAASDERDDVIGPSFELVLVSACDSQDFRNDG